MRDAELVRRTSELVGERLALIGRFAEGETGGALLLERTDGTERVLTQAMNPAADTPD